MADNTAPSDLPPSSSTLQAPNSTSASDTQPNTQSISNPASQTIPASSGEDTVLDNQQEQDLDAELNLNGPTDGMNAEGAAPDGVVPAPGPGDASSAAPEINGVGPSSGSSSSIPPLIEPRIPQKKDTSLREFLGKMDDYAPLIPDAVTDYYLTLAGLPPPPETDRRLARLLALATQKFIADIAADAYQYSRIRSTNTTSNNPLTGLGGAAGFGMNLPQGAGGGDGGEGAAGKGGKKDAGKSQPLGGPRAGYGGGGAGGGQGRTVLTMEDLGMAVGEYGVNVKRGEFYR